jgi:hypothetical protein
VRAHVCRCGKTARPRGATDGQDLPDRLSRRRDWGSGTAYLRPLEAFRQGLRELGWVEGQNVLIEYRFAEGRLDRLPALVGALLPQEVPEGQRIRAWLDSWAGVGHVVDAMHAKGYNVRLTPSLFHW